MTNVAGCRQPSSDEFADKDLGCCFLDFIDLGFAKAFDLAQIAFGGCLDSLHTQIHYAKAKKK